MQVMSDNHERLQLNLGGSCLAMGSKTAPMTHQVRKQRLHCMLKVISRWFGCLWQIKLCNAQAIMPWFQALQREARKDHFLLG